MNNPVQENKLLKASRYYIAKCERGEATTVDLEIFKEGIKELENEKTMNTTGKEIKNWPTDQEITDAVKKRFPNDDDPDHISCDENYLRDMKCYGFREGIQWLKSQLQEPAEGEFPTEEQKQFLASYGVKYIPPEQPVKSAEEERKEYGEMMYQRGINNCNEHHFYNPKSFSREDLKEFAIYCSIHEVFDVTTEQLLNQWLNSPENKNRKK